MAECSNCGEVVGSDAAFCPSCGTELDAEESASDPAAAPADGGPDLSDPGTESGGAFGLSRRQLLGGAVVAAGGVGWYTFLRDDGSSGPTGVVKQTWSLWESGDLDAYRALFHSESPARQQLPSDPAEFGPADGVSWTIEERTVTSKTESEAVVREVYRWDAPDQELIRVTDLYQLRIEDGEWKLWDIQFQDSEPVNGTSAA